MKIIVTDDFFPELSHIDLQIMCEQWREASLLGQEMRMSNRMNGLGYLALADQRKTDAENYFLLADLCMHKKIIELMEAK